MSASRKAAPSPGPGGSRPDTASSAAMASTTPSTPTPMPGKRAAPLSIVSTESEAATRSPPALSPRFAEPPSPGILATAASTPGPSGAASTGTPAGTGVGGGAGVGSRTASVKRRGRTRAPSISKASSKSSPGLGPSKISPRLATTPSTPVPNMAQPLPPPADQPEFAELLTPAQLRGRRRHAPVTVASMGGLGALSGQPILPGHSRLGWTTDDGNLYRGAVSDPTTDAVRPPEGDDNDEAITDASSSGSSGSSWSWGSGIEHGARATMAVVQRFGHAIGVRRGSHSSGTTATSTVSSSSSSSSSEDGIAGRIGRALNRSVSRNTDGSSPERPRRVYVPRRREFTLLVPPADVGDEGPGIVLPPRPGAPPGEGTSVARVVSTPVLAPVLEALRKARIAAGVGVETPGNVGRRAHSHHHHHHHGRGGGAGPDVPVRRGGSAPGRSRQQSRFAPPPIPRPVISRAQTQSRLDALRGEHSFVRPKSASDLLGLTTKPKSASDLQGLKTGGGSFGSSLNSLSTLTPATSGDDGIPTEPTLPQSPPRPTPRPAWWLDVSCPTWKDLRDIGELLGLHPLTLEDVLHQDPREKLDVYDTLGYYFVVVRALDEQYFKYTPGSATSPPGAEIAANAVVSVEVPTKERTSRGWGFGRQTGRNASKTGEKVEIVEDNPGQEGLEGVGVGGINLYLVVFADGIVSLHYDDVSKHTARVRDRVLSPTELLVPTSDWIMHGLLDSIVDAFFPLAGFVDGAVDDMDSLTIDPTRDPRTRERDPLNGTSPAPSDTLYSDSTNHQWLDAEEKLVDGEKEKEEEEKSGPFSTLRRRLRPKTTAGASPAATAAAATAKNALDVATVKLKKATKKGTASTFDLPRPLLYLKLFFLPTTSARPAHHDKGDAEVFDRSTMLRSITNMRRLVTGLSRLLVGKQGVVLSLLKRASENRSDSDVEAYLSDVHDHILLLQTSLYHYEYILAHCQPAYLSYLNVSGALSRGGTDIMILALSTVTIGILPMQWVLGLFSMNVHMPVNGHPEWHTLDDCDPTERDDCVYAPYNLFGIIVGIIFLIACGVVLLIRYWRWLARKKWTNRRGGDLPNTWDGFWGWE